MNPARFLSGLIVLGLGLGSAFSASVQTSDARGEARLVRNQAGGRWGRTPAVRLQPVRILGDVDSDDEAVAFHLPSDLAFDAQGRVYVLDTGNHRIQVFGSEGKFLKTIGRQGQGPGEFMMPNAIDVDAQGNLFVCEAQSARIQVIAPDGRIAKTLKTSIGFIGDLHVLKTRAGFLATESLSGGQMALQMNQPAGPPPPLFRVLDAEAAILRRFGEGRDFDEPLANQIGNQVQTVLGRNDEVFAAFSFQNRVERYSPEGKRVWRAERPLSYLPGVLSQGSVSGSGGERGGHSGSMRLPEMMRCASGAAVDGKGRLWVATLSRPLNAVEKASATKSSPGGHNLPPSPSPARASAFSLKTDAYRLDVFDPDGSLLGSIPVESFVDAVFIEGDRLFLLDKVRGVRFLEFKIVG